jgi:DNA (cytosine-5)-methyltransferase 1
LRLLVEYNGHAVAPNLIPEFERVVDEAGPEWFLMENVPAAPVPAVPGFTVQTVQVSDHWVGGETRCLRAFSFGSWPLDSRPTLSFAIEWPALHRPDPAPPVLASGFDAGGKRGRQRGSSASRLGYTLATWDASRRLQGLPEDYDLPGFTVAGKIKAIGNGVPLAMGRAVARAVTAALAVPSPAGEAVR